MLSACFCSLRHCSVLFLMLSFLSCLSYGIPRAPESESRFIISDEACGWLSSLRAAHVFSGNHHRCGLKGSRRELRRDDGLASWQLSKSSVTLYRLCLPRLVLNPRCFAMGRVSFILIRCDHSMSSLPVVVQMPYFNVEC